MPVLKKKNNDRILHCENCGTKSRAVTPRSVAGDLDACEQLEKEGWDFTVGFFAMLSGHQVLCPRCSTGKVVEHGSQCSA